MKLEDSKSSFNFYESFSDLIFCTLVLFIILVLFLVLNVNDKVVDISTELQESKNENSVLKIKLKEAANDLLLLEKQVSRMKVQYQKDNVKLETINNQITKINRFTGQSGPTQFLIAFDFSYVPCKYVFVDNAIKNEDDIAYTNESVSMTTIRRNKLKYNYFNIAKRYNETEMISILKNIAHNGENLKVVYHYHLWASKIVDKNKNIKREYLSESKEIISLVYNKIDHVTKLFTKYSKPKIAHKGLPVLHFDTDEINKKIIINDSKFLAKEFTEVLKSVYGPGIIIQYKPKVIQNKNPYELPQWVNEQVLVPSGYINRAPDIEKILNNTNN